jgi:phosphate transport system substrate-binding protein
VSTLFKREKEGKRMKTIIILAGIALSGLCAVPASAQSINAAGATFPAPIYQKWFGEYKAAHPDVQINYQPIGSGGGIRQLQEGTVDFGASDMPMTDEQLAPMKVKPLHFPTVLGAVVLTYNVPGVTGTLKFTPEVIAGIFLGEIRKWSDSKIKAVNPGVNLSDKDIVVVHRSDASGTSFAFTDYLSKVSAGWKSKVGVNAAVSWPVGLGQKGNDGVSGTVKQTPNSVGYVELLYAVQNKMTYGDVKNAAGKFVTASSDSVTAAAASVKDMPSDFRVSIANAPGAAAYPISTFTWLLIPTQIPDAAKKKAIADFLKWMMTDGQKEAQPLSYAPLPKSVVSKEEKQIALIR